MTAVFADTQWWVATTSSRDPWAEVAAALQQNLQDATVVTTEEVLVEFAGFLSGSGPYLRRRVVEVIGSCYALPTVTVVAQSHESLLQGLALYEARADKEYSLVDCISMLTMRGLGITEVLTADHHFEQEGFVARLGPSPR